VINFLSHCLFSTSTRLLLVSTMEVTCTKPHRVKVSSCNSSASSHFQSLDFQECLHDRTTRAVQFLLKHVYSFTCQLALSYHLFVIWVTQLVPLFFFGSNVGYFFRYQRCCSKVWHGIPLPFLFSTVHYLAACLSVLHNIGRKLASMPASEINGLSPKTSNNLPIPS